MSSPDHPAHEHHRSRASARDPRLAGQPASTGQHEAVELRDGDKHRYLGKGVRKAVEHVNDTLSEVVPGFDARELLAIDHALYTIKSSSPTNGTTSASSPASICPPGTRFPCEALDWPT